MLFLLSSLFAFSQGGTLTDIDGAPLRGTALIIGKEQPQSLQFALDPETWSQIKNDFALNTVRLCWIDPWYRDNDPFSTDPWTVQDILPYVDSCVALATQMEMNIIINYHNIDEHQGMAKDFSDVADFWEVIAPRFAENERVYYELTNEPTFNKADYLLPAFRSGMLEVYDQVRSDAPDRQILLFSIYNYRDPASGPDQISMKEIVDHYAADIDWEYSSVAYHLYGSDGGSAAILELMPDYRVICTEWNYPGTFDYIPIVDGHAVNSQTLENIDNSWIDWRNWNEVDFLKLSSQLLPDAQLKGYWWGSIPSADAVTTVDGPPIIYPGESIHLLIDYKASAERDLQVVVQLDEEPYTTFGYEAKTVGTGTASAVFDIQLSSDAPLLENGYQYQVFLSPVGGDYDDLTANSSITDIDCLALPTVDLVTELNAPEEVATGEIVEVGIAFQTTETRELVVLFQLDSEPYTPYRSANLEVAAGYHDILVPLHIPTETPLAIDAYQYQVWIAPLGSNGSYDLRLHNLSQIDVDVVENEVEACPSDINSDGEVNVHDFIIFNSRFGQICDCPEDIDGDGVVGVNDLLAFNSAYGGLCE